MSGVIRRERCTPFYSRKGRGIKRGILSMYYLWIIFDFLKYLFFNVEWRLCEKEYFMKKSKPLPSNNFHPSKKERYNFETMVKISTPEKYKPPFSKLETGREKKREFRRLLFFNRPFEPIRTRVKYAKEGPERGSCLSLIIFIAFNIFANRRWMSWIKILVRKLLSSDNHILFSSI